MAPSNIGRQPEFGQAVAILVHNLRSRAPRDFRLVCDPLQCNNFRSQLSAIDFVLAMRGSYMSSFRKCSFQHSSKGSMEPQNDKYSVCPPCLMLSLEGSFSCSSSSTELLPNQSFLFKSQQ